MAFRLSWPASLRRWRRWMVALVALVVVRLAIPFALRPLLASQASKALHAQVEIGSVALSLFRCGIALNDVTIRPVGGAAASAEDLPLVAWKRFAVAVRWLPLFQKRVLLREVLFDSPRLAVDREEDGRITLLALVPWMGAPPAASPTPAPSRAEAGSGWSFGVDRLALRDGGLRFRDFRIKGAEPLFVNLPDLTVSDIALGPGIYGDPSQLHVAVNFEGGSLDLRARLTQRVGGQALEADVTAQNIPLRRAPYYVPEVGWRTLAAWLDARLAYRFESKGQNEVRGTIALRDVVVRMPNFDEPAVEYRLLRVKLDPLDLAGRRVHVSELEIDGATSHVGRPGGDRFPLLTAVLRRSAAGEPTTTAGAGPRTAGAAPAPAPPWHWSLSSMRVTDSRIRLLRTQAPLDIGLDVTISELADDAERPGHLRIVLNVGKGSVHVEGAVRLSHLGFAGTVRVVDFPLAELLAAAAVLPADLLQEAELGSELTVEAGLAAEGSDAAALAPGEARLRGRVSLVGLRVAAPGPQGFSLGAKSIEVGITELRTPGVLPTGNGAAGQTVNDVLLRGRVSLADLLLTGADATTFAVGARAFDLAVNELIVPGILPGGGAGDAARPLRVTLGKLELVGPSVKVTRTPEGFVLPSFSISPAASPAGAGPAVTEVHPKAPQPEPAKEPAAARPIEISLDSLRLVDGKIAVVDRTVQPFLEGKIAALTIDVRGFSWPALAVRDIRLTATTSEQCKIKVAGGLDPRKGQIELTIDKLPLAPFNPYVTSLAGYSIGGGKASVTTKVVFAQERYDARNALTLHNLDVRGAGGESLFQQSFGIPLSTALALMRDMNGDIALDIPVQMDPEGVNVGVATVIRQALQRAIMGALTSPLKLMGAVFGGGKVQSVTPTAIAFRVGRSEFAPGGAEQVEQLAALLASRPGIAVTLATATTAVDVRWLREQALGAEWADEGVFGKVQGLTQRGARKTISRALEARAQDEEGKLEPDDAATLDRWLDERPPIPAEQLRALAEARLAAMEKGLREQHGIEANRVTRREIAVEPTGDVPAVLLELGAVASP